MSEQRDGSSLVIFHCLGWCQDPYCNLFQNCNSERLLLSSPCSHLDAGGRKYSGYNNGIDLSLMGVDNEQSSECQLLCCYIRAVQIEILTVCDLH